MERDFSGFDFRLKQTAALSKREHGEILSLFEANYRQANSRFLEKSLGRLGHAAIALRTGVVVGFALGETRVMDLPRLPAQTVSFLGLSCVAPEFRRQGLFMELGRLTITATEVPEQARRLLCGRTAHPAAQRTIVRFPGAVPEAGRPPTPWQQEVGSAIAAAYGVHDFDPQTFVCIGDGTPIGYPRIEVATEPQEWDVFRPVNRDRGDALLTISWIPDSPAGW